MKVLQFVASGEPGGGTNHVMQLLTGLGSDVRSALLTQTDSHLFQQSQTVGIEVYGGKFFRSRVDPSAIRCVATTIQQLQPDLIHCHGGRAAFFRSFVSTRIPTVYTVHGFHHAKKMLLARSLGWAAELWSIRRMTKILFVSHHDWDLAVRQHLLAKEKKHAIIHNGIKPLVPDVASKRIGVGFVGRFSHPKNPQLFLDIVQRLPNIKFVMAGDGDLDSEVREKLNRCGLNDRVELLGGMDHASALKVIAKLDVLVMTSRWEGLPLVLLEAMFLKVPVVTTQVGGIPEVIQHGETGLLSATAEPDDLANHVRSLLENQELRHTIVTKAFERAVSHFSEQTMLSKIRDCYQECKLLR